MKQSLLAILAIVLVSCSKPEIAANNANNISATSTEPSATYRFYRVTAGSNESVAFDITFTNMETVKKFHIYRVPAVEVSVIDAPVNKLYTTYDHIIADYPHYSENVWYYFAFDMKDGTTKLLNKFQVY